MAVQRNPRRVLRQAEVAREPWLRWNAFVDLLAIEEFETLSPVQRVAHLAFWYDAEVQNGGHLQYFENRGVSQLELSADSLRRLGSSQLAELLVRAGARWQAIPRETLENDQDFVDELLEAEFESFDSSYHEVTPSVMDLLREYLAENEPDFIEYSLTGRGHG